MSVDYSNYCITEIGQNTEKSTVDLMKLAVTQTPVKNHQLMLIGKTLKEYDNKNNNIKGYRKRMIKTCRE